MRYLLVFVVGYWVGLLPTQVEGPAGFLLSIPMFVLSALLAVYVVALGVAAIL